MDDKPEENEQRGRLIKLGEKIKQSKTPKKSLTKTQKEIKYWKDDKNEVKIPPTIKEEEEKGKEENDCSIKDCSITGGKKSRKNKRRKRITRKFKKNRKFRKTSYKR